MSNKSWQNIGLALMVIGAGAIAAPHVGLASGHWGPWFFIGIIAVMFGYVFYDIPKECPYEASKLQPLPPPHDPDDTPAIVALNDEASSLMDAAGWPELRHR